MVIAFNLLGGISFYILIQMVFSFANFYSVLPPIEYLFMSFLQYYGYDFKCSQMYIINGESIMVHPEEVFQSDELMVIDMFNPSINAAANVTKFPTIRALFQKVFLELQQGITKEISPT